MERILVVDDDPAIREFISSALELEGYEVLVSPNGAEGAKLARQSAPALVLMDLMMPVLHGVSAIRALRDDPRTAQLCIVAMSAGMTLRAQFRTPAGRRGVVEAVRSGLPVHAGYVVFARTTSRAGALSAADGGCAYAV